MKPNPKAISLIFSLVCCLVISQVSADRGRLGKIRRIELRPEVILDERSAPLLSAGGKVGFISSVTGGSLLSFSTTSGQLLSSVVVGETAGIASFVQIGKRRLIAVPAANDPDHDYPATVSIIDATRARQLELSSLIALPLAEHITPVTRAVLTADGRFGAIASSFDEPALFSFSVETGQIISRLELAGRPSEIALQDPTADNHHSLIAITSSAANTLSLIKLDDSGQLSLVTNFSSADGRFSDANNPAFSADGRTVYVAAAIGDQLLQIAAGSGVQQKRVKVGPAPQRITVTTGLDGHEMIGVTCTRPPDSDKPGGVAIVTNRSGRLAIKTEFAAPAPIEFSAANNVVFASDAAVAFVGSTTGILFAFSTETGELQSHQVVGSKLLSLALNNKSRTLAAVRQTPRCDEIVIAGFDFLDSEVSAAMPQTVNPEGDSATASEPHRVSARSAARPETTPLEPSRLLAGRSNDRVSLHGANFSRRTKVYVASSGGPFVQVKPRRVRLRSSHNLVVALAGKLNQLTAQPGVLTFRLINPNAPARAPSTDHVVKVEGPEISRAQIRRVHGEPTKLQLTIGGANFSTGAVVELIKDGMLVGLQPATLVDGSTLTINMPAQKVEALGRFQVRVTNPGEVASSLKTVDLPAAANAAIVNPNREALSARRESSLGPATAVRQVRAEAGDHDVQILVDTDGAMQYEDFTLSNPSRIVVDVIGVRNAFGNKTIPVRRAAVARVRVGQPRPRVVRVVLDISGLPAYRVTRHKASLVITAGR